MTGVTDAPAGRRPDVAALLDALARAGHTVATAESLSGGLLCAALTEIAGSSRVVRGGIVAYHGDVKTGLVGVDADLLRTGGAVQAEVAAQLADGARDRCRATWGVGTTGVAGPDPSDGRAVGTVYVGLSGPRGRQAREFVFSGDRRGIREATVAAALGMLAQAVAL